MMSFKQYRQPTMDLAGTARNNERGDPIVPKMSRGFTLIELMIVLTIISLLAGIAIPIGNRAILRSKEAVLKSNLHTLRSLIDQYTADRLKAPQSLQDLVTAGYLREIPKDPITGSSESWEVVQGDTNLLPDQTETGIVDVKSGSSEISTEGSAYNSW
jgi:general secretion pathway protein G